MLNGFLKNTQKKKTPHDFPFKKNRGEGLFYL